VRSWPSGQLPPPSGSEGPNPDQNPQNPENPENPEGPENPDENPGSSGCGSG
jgi:hypothetical protein